MGASYCFFGSDRRLGHRNAPTIDILHSRMRCAPVLPGTAIACWPGRHLTTNPNFRTPRTHPLSWERPVLETTSPMLQRASFDAGPQLLAQPVGAGSYRMDSPPCLKLAPVLRLRDV